MSVLFSELSPYLLILFYYLLIGFCIVSGTIIGDRLTSDSEQFDAELDTGFTIIGILVWPFLVLVIGSDLVFVGMRWYLRWLRGE
jgi:hypothetical protein